MAAGLPRIEVKFLIDANGILHVSAREQRSGKQAEIEVKPPYGLTDEQVESMILESFDNAEEDFRKRQVIEARNEAQTILDAIAKARSHAAWRELTAGEIATIETRSAALRSTMENEGSEDYKAVRASIESLDHATRRFAELMMDSAVGEAMGGKTMAQAGEQLGVGPTAPHPFAAAQIEESSRNK